MIFYFLLLLLLYFISFFLKKNLLNKKKALKKKNGGRTSYFIHSSIFSNSSKNCFTDTLSWEQKRYKKNKSRWLGIIKISHTITSIWIKCYWRLIIENKFLIIIIIVSTSYSRQIIKITTTTHDTLTAIRKVYKFYW